MDEANAKGNYRDEIYAKAVRAGKRTYFFDVKSTRGGDLYLTITESKKQFSTDGKFYFEKHKLFLYKEDFDKFSDGLTEVLDKIEELRENSDPSDYASESNQSQAIDESNQSEEIDGNTDNNEFKEVDFDDLGK